jgi:hypothetical protein
MKATITVPAGFVPYLRSGLRGELRCAAEELAHLLLASDDRAPEATFPTPLHALLTILIPLGEIGLKDTNVPGDAVINLNVGGVYVVKGLKDEHSALVAQLDKLPKTTRKAIREAASAEVAEFGEFVRAAEEQVNCLNRCPERPATTHPPRPQLRTKPSRVRRPRPQRGV